MLKRAASGLLNLEAQFWVAAVPHDWHMCQSCQAISLNGDNHLNNCPIKMLSDAYYQY